MPHVPRIYLYYTRIQGQLNYQARRQGGCRGVHMHPPFKLMTFIKSLINCMTPSLKHFLWLSATFLDLADTEHVDDNHMTDVL